MIIHNYIGVWKFFCTKKARPICIFTVICVPLGVVIRERGNAVFRLAVNHVVKPFLLSFRADF